MEDDLINFDIIETQKENIQSLPGGRSAKALASAFGPSILSPMPTPGSTRNINDNIRQEFELEIIAISDSDDPLDIYDRYVKWTLNAYPSAQSTADSQLRPLLERATKSFQSAVHYKNDPRYLKLWLTYIRLFSDAPRETFAYLARHNIGETLALFYEEFAAWLEGAGRWNQAEEVYKLGMEREARPAERLLRKFREFQQRYQQQPESIDEPSSPALPTVRPALAAKLDPFASTTPARVDPQVSRLPSGASASTSRAGKQKLSIFSDADVPDSSSKTGLGQTSKGWESIGSIHDRKKENTVEARPWAGEIMKAGKNPVATSKLMIFKDQCTVGINNTNASISSHSEMKSAITKSSRTQQTPVNPKTGRVELVFANVELVYPNPQNPNIEISFQESRAKHRGWLDKSWSNPQEDKILDLNLNIEESSEIGEAPTSQLSSAVRHDAGNKDREGNIDIEEDAPDVKQERPRKTRTMEVNPETQTVKTNLESPTGRKLKRKKSTERKLIDKKSVEKRSREMSDANTNTASRERGIPGDSNASQDASKHNFLIEESEKATMKEPTMTLYTKAATDDILNFFNQPLKCTNALESQGDNADESDYEEDDYTSAGESTGTGKISAGVSEFGDDETSRSIGAQDSTEPRSVSPWSDFTSSRHVPTVDEKTKEDNLTEGLDKIMLGSHSPHGVEESEWDVVTPIEGVKIQSTQSRFVPIPPEDYEAPIRPYRDPSQVGQNRLPFMTPIVEKTECSIVLPTMPEDKDYFNSKTASVNIYEDKEQFYTETSSRQNDNLDSTAPEIDDAPPSSPFQKVVNDAKMGRQKPKPKPKTVHRVETKSTGISSSKKEVKGPAIKDALCNPMDDFVRHSILESLAAPISTYAGYHNYGPKTCGKGPEIRKFVKALTKVSKNASEKTTTNLSMPPTVLFPHAASKPYTIRRELGKGADAPVYLAEQVTTDSESIEDDPNSCSLAALQHHPPFCAIKAESPPTPWEFYIMSTAHRRLGLSRATHSLAKPYSMHIFADEGYLVEEYRDQGTLLDLVNIAKSDPTINNGLLDECVAIFYAVELLRTVEALHSKGLLHGDLKADNCLVRLEDLASTTTMTDGKGSKSESSFSSSHWSPNYRPDGSDGWSAKGLTLIDFGRGIDMRAFRADVGFLADWKTTKHDCAEMREMRPWTWQVDWWGLAGVVHVLLFGRWIEDVTEKQTQTQMSSSTSTSDSSLGGSNGGAVGGMKRYRLKESLKRYWATELWGAFFDTLLNPGRVAGEISASGSGSRGGVSGGAGGDRAREDVWGKLGVVRAGMEEWLVANGERRGLKTLLKRLEERSRDRERRR